MHSFSEFHKKAQVAETNINRDKFYRNEIYKIGEWILTESGKVGKIIRRGPNYVLCLTAEETTFRSWITDIKEVFEIGTDAYREYLQSLTPGEKKQPFSKIKVKQVIPPDPKKDKMENNEYVAAVVNALSKKTSGVLSANVKSVDETWRYDNSAKMANKDPKGLGAAGVGGGDAPGMKMAEPAGTAGKPKVKKPMHSCATKVEHSEWGEGNCIKEMHTLDEEGHITHYDVMFEHGLEQNVSVAALNVLVSEMHEHVINVEKNQEVLEAKKAKKLDPVGKEDGDVDNDGDSDSSDSYLKARRAAVSKAMGKKMKEEVEEIEEKKGLYANIHAKRERGERPARPGEEDYPAKDAFKKSAKTAKKESVELDEVAPPGAKAERMVKHIKKSYAKDGKLTDKEKSIAYATAWKNAKKTESYGMEDDEDDKKEKKMSKAAKAKHEKGEKKMDEGMKQARANVGASTCWDGYEAKGTKKKGGKEVPNCVKKEHTFSDWRKEIAEKK